MSRTKEQVASVTSVNVKGMFKLQILDKKTRKVVGDSGWSANQVTAKGFNDMLAGCVIGAANSQQAASGVLATQSTAVNSTHISLAGTALTAVSMAPTTLADGTARLTCSFDGANLATNTVTIGTIGLHYNSDITNSMLAGQTYTTSQFTSDQDVNATYEIQFS